MELCWQLWLMVLTIHVLANRHFNNISCPVPVDEWCLLSKLEQNATHCSLQTGTMKLHLIAVPLKNSCVQFNGMMLENIAWILAGCECNFQPNSHSRRVPTEQFQSKLKAPTLTPQGCSSLACPHIRGSPFDLVGCMFSSSWCHQSVPHHVTHATGCECSSVTSILKKPCAETNLKDIACQRHLTRN